MALLANVQLVLQQEDYAEELGLFAVLGVVSRSHQSFDVFRGDSLLKKFFGVVYQSGARSSTVVVDGIAAALRAGLELLDGGVALHGELSAEGLLLSTVHLSPPDAGHFSSGLLEIGQQLLAVAAPGGVELDDPVELRVVDVGSEVSGSESLNLAGRSFLVSSISLLLLLLLSLLTTLLLTSLVESLGVGDEFCSLESKVHHTLSSSLSIVVGRFVLIVSEEFESGEALDSVGRAGLLVSGHVDSSNVDDAVESLGQFLELRGESLAVAAPGGWG